MPRRNHKARHRAGRRLHPEHLEAERPATYDQLASDLVRRGLADPVIIAGHGSRPPRSTQPLGDTDV